jgi:hypothetical protein
MIVIWNKDKEIDWTKPSVYPIHREPSYRIKIPFSEYLASILIHLKGFFSAELLFIILLLTQQ